MRQALRLLTAFVVLLSAEAFSQTPVQVMPQLLPPYSLQVSEYYSGTQSKLQVLLLNRDINQPAIQVKLRMTVESQNCRLRTKEAAQTPSFTLTSGVPYYLSPQDLQAFFSAANLDFTGSFSEQQYIQTGRFPEGLYSFYFEAVEIYSGNLVSNKGFSLAWLTLADPPILNSPSKAESVSPSNPQNIIFNWTPRHNTSPTAAYYTDYVFTLAEYNDQSLGPDASFTSSPPFFIDSLPTTTYLYGSDKPQLVPGKRYAWRVQSKAKSGSLSPGGGAGGGLAMFRNNGFSEVHWFIYQNNCAAPLGIGASVQGQRATIEWQNDPQHLEWKVEYREVNLADAAWFSLANTLPRVMLTDLKPGTQYEYRVGGACLAGQFTYSPLMSFTTNGTAVNYLPSCGDSTLPPPGGGQNLQTLSSGSIIKAGSFDVNVGYATGTGNFTGTGYVMVPWLANAKVEVRFTNITLSQDYNLLSGVIETTYDPTESGIDDIDEYMDVFTAGYGVGDVVTGTVTADTTVSFAIQMPNGIKVQLPEGYNSATGSGTGPVTIVLQPQGGGEPVSYTVDKLPTTILDAGGNLYQIDKNGQVIPVGQAGGLSLLQTANTRHLDADKAVVRFVDYSEKQVYAFDAWKPVYKKSSAFNQEYERLNEDYYVSQKAIAPGKVDYLKAVVTVTDPGIKPDSIQFVSGKGVVYKDILIAPDTYEITVVGGPEKDAQEIYAVYKQSGGKTLNLGKVKVSSYPVISKKLVLVTVDPNTINADSISAGLNRIYNPINIRWQVSKDPATFTDRTWDQNGNGQLDISDDNEFSLLTDEMKALSRLYRQTNSMDEQTQYMFIVRYNDDLQKNVFGEMPRGKQFGYLFVNSSNSLEFQNSIGLVAAHEVGHGVFSLKHVFDYGLMIEANGLLDNIMEYPAGKGLAKMQWDYCHDPAIALGFLADDDESLYVEKIEDGIYTTEETSFITPEGKLITLPAKTRINSYLIETDVLNTNTSKFPNGVIYGFQKPGEKEFCHSNSATGQPLGYYQVSKSSNGNRSWSYAETNGQSQKVQYQDNTQQPTAGTTKKITIVHNTGSICSPHDVQFKEVNYAWHGIIASGEYYYPSYLNLPVVNTVGEVQTAMSATDCSAKNDDKLKRLNLNGVSKSKKFKNGGVYKEYVGNGEDLKLTEDERRELQAFFDALGEELATPVNVYVYPKNGSRAGEASQAYTTDSLQGKRGFKLELSGDSQTGDAEVNHLGIFNFPFFIDLGLGFSQCAVDHMNKAIEMKKMALAKEGKSLGRIRVALMKIYHVIKGSIVCKLGESGNENSFMCGVAFEFLNSLDVVEIVEGLADLGFGLLKASVWEAPRAYIKFIKKSATLTPKLIAGNITLKQYIEESVPEDVKVFYAKCKTIAHNLWDYYVTNANNWRYGQLTMMAVPIVLTGGEYAFTKLGTFARFGKFAGTAEKIANFANKANRLTNLGFEVLQIGTSRVLAKIKNPLKVLDNNLARPAENLLPDEILTTLDGTNEAQRIEDFVDDIDDLASRVSFITGGEAATVKTALASITDNERIYVAIHGNADKFILLMNGVEREMTHRSLATWLQKEGFANKDIVLLSCADVSTAQNLANKLGGSSKVVAWEGQVTVYSSGAVEGAGACKRFSPGNTAEDISPISAPKGKPGASTTLTEQNRAVKLGNLNDLFDNLALGELIGQGGNKNVFQIIGREDQVVAILKEGKPVSSIDKEILDLKLLSDNGFPVVEVLGRGTVDGRPAMIMKKYMQGSKEVVKRVENEMLIVGESDLLNGRSIEDLKKIKNILESKKIKINDLQFLIASDGGIVIADPLEIFLGEKPSRWNRQMIDKLIVVAAKNSY